VAHDRRRSTADLDLPRYDAVVGREPRSEVECEKTVVNTVPVMFRDDADMRQEKPDWHTRRRAQDDKHLFRSATRQTHHTMCSPHMGLAVGTLCTRSVSVRGGRLCVVQFTSPPPLVHNRTIPTS